MANRMNGKWSGRGMALGTTGLTAAIALLMVIVPASGSVAPQKVFTAPYKGTASAPNGYNDFGGCSKSKLTAPAWHSTTGVITLADSASAKTCGKQLGYVGGNSYVYGDAGIEVALPFTVGANGNHSVMTSWTINIASAWSHAASAVCSKNINYFPALYQSSYSYCEAGTYVSVSFEAFLSDLSNNSWYNYNYSYGSAYNDSVFENYTDCYNYGTPTCYNNTGYNAGYQYGYNEAGMAAWTWNGATTITTWSNGTGMVKGHHYIVILDVYASAEAFAESANLLAPWAGSALASINLATLGNGATVNSVTVL